MSDLIGGWREACIQELTKYGRIREMHDVIISSRACDARGNGGGD